MANFFKFGKFDSNDFKHLFAGVLCVTVISCLVIFVGSFEDFMELRGEWVGLIGGLCAAYLWEFGQGWFYSAKLDWKDILVTFVGGLIAALVIHWIR